MHEVIEGLKFSVPIFKHKLTKTGVSAAIDTLGSHGALVSIITGSAAAAIKFYFYHASASTTLAASGTAFTTNPTLTTAATASQRHAILFQGQPGMKRYIRIKVSALTASCNVVVASQLVRNRTVPVDSTLGSYTSILRPAV